MYSRRQYVMVVVIIALAALALMPGGSVEVRE